MFALGAGFALFQDGKCIRRRAADPESVFVDEGDPLPPELENAEQFHDEETRVLAISAMLLGRPFDEIVFSDEVTLQVYEEY